MSMSVNSLIDRFEQGPGRSSAPPSTPATAQLAPAATIDDPGLMKLLGVERFPLGEEAYIETIRLRQEIERRKQEELRRQLADKNLEIIRMAMAAHIPPHLIPVMCVNPDEYHRTLLQQSASASAAGASGTPVPPPMMVPIIHPQAPAPGAPPYAPFAPPASPTKRSASAMYHQDHLNVNPTLPIHYRFGEGRPHSPAKRGAVASAQLSAPSFSVRPPMTPQQQTQRSRRSSGASHQRTASVPDGSQLTSPNITKTLQVKPSPAQPPAKNKPPPTQESMTSFQHIIQFHHWKPGDKSPPNNTKSPAPGRAPSTLSAVSATSGTSAASGAAPASHSPSDNSTAPASPDTQENSPQHINPHAPPASSTPREPSHKRYKSEVVRDSDDETIDDTTEMSPQQAPPAKFPHDIMS